MPTNLCSPKRHRTPITIKGSGTIPAQVENKLKRLVGCFSDKFVLRLRGTFVSKLTQKQLKLNSQQRSRFMNEQSWNTLCQFLHHFCCVVTEESLWRLGWWQRLLMPKHLVARHWLHLRMFRATYTSCQNISIRSTHEAVYKSRTLPNATVLASILLASYQCNKVANANEKKAEWDVQVMYCARNLWDHLFVCYGHSVTHFLLCRRSKLCEGICFVRVMKTKLKAPTD